MRLHSFAKLNQPASIKVMSDTFTPWLDARTAYSPSCNETCISSRTHPELPVGVYRVAYSEPGFREKVIEGLEQAVGHTRTLNVDLAVRGVVQQVKVSDLDPQDLDPQLDQTSATYDGINASNVVNQARPAFCSPGDESKYPDKELQTERTSTARSNNLTLGTAG